MKTMMTTQFSARASSERTVFRRLLLLFRCATHAAVPAASCFAASPVLLTAAGMISMPMLPLRVPLLPADAAATSLPYRAPRARRAALLAGAARAPICVRAGRLCAPPPLQEGRASPGRT